MNKFLKIVTLPFRAPGILKRHYFLPRSFGSCGKDVSISNGYVFAGKKNFYFGNHIAIGPNAVFYSTLAKIIVKDYVMFSPNVTIITGEHATGVVGTPMIMVGDEGKKKLGGGFDKDVIIEEDVWIGSNVTILKGVTIGRGSVIHAGLVIEKSIPPYSIVYSPKVIVPRFTEEEIEIHNKALEELINGKK